MRILVFLFPFLYFVRFIFPDSSLLVIENDFGVLYHPYKAYIADFVAHGHFPLWSPSEAGGYALFGNPFAAVLYPLNVLPIAARLAFGNYNAWFHQIFTVFGVSIFALGLYEWLLRTFRTPWAAFFTVVVFSSSWDISLFMRFPNAIHALAWLPWVLVALHSVHETGRPRAILGGALALICQITAGYPYFVVYGFFVYAGYLLFLHFQQPREQWRKPLALEALTLCSAVAISYPYVQAVSRLMRVTTDRGGGDYAYSTSDPFGPVDLLGSFVFPPVTSYEGCCYAGILTSFFILLYLWQGQDTREKFAIVLGLCGLLTVIFGYRSYLFTLVWSLLPTVGQMRVFPRMTVALIPLLAMACHQGCALFLGELGKPRAERELPVRSVWLLFGGIFAVQLVLYTFRSSLNGAYLALTASYLPGGWYEFDFLAYAILTLCVVLFLWRLDPAKLRHFPAVSACLMAFVVTYDNGNQGHFLWSLSLSRAVAGRGVEPVERGRKLVRQAWALTKADANFWPLVATYFTAERHPQRFYLTAAGLGAAPVLNFNYARYTEFYSRWSETPNFARFVGTQKLLFHATTHESLDDLLEDVDLHSGNASPPTIQYYDGDALLMGIDNRTPGYLTWVDNYDAGWTAELDGVPVPIQLTLRTFKSVRLQEPGRHRLRFVYRPPISGFAYVLSALGVLSLGAAFFVDKRRRRALGA